MTVELGVIISLISVILAVTSFVFARKKENKTDGFEMGSFFGEIKSEIGNIKTMIEELKEQTKSMPKEIDSKISRAIHEHEIHYDDKIANSILDHEKRYHNHN